HRQLRARLADRLRCDHADSLTELNEPASGEITAVAALADATAGGAGQHRAGLHLLDAALLDRRRLVLVGLVLSFHDPAGAERVDDLLERHAADDAIAQRLDDFA